MTDNHLKYNTDMQTFPRIGNMSKNRFFIAPMTIKKMFFFCLKPNNVHAFFGYVKHKKFKKKFINGQTYKTINSLMSFRGTALTFYVLFYCNIKKSKGIVYFKPYNFLYMFWKYLLRFWDNNGEKVCSQIYIFFRMSDVM